MAQSETREPEMSVSELLERETVRLLAGEMEVCELEPGLSDSAFSQLLEWSSENNAIMCVPHLCITL